MQNPFRFGSVVSGEDFADRRRELAELGRELAGGQHVFLLSPRRYGKTSLILTLLARLRAQGLLTAYVDVFRATTAAQLLELTAQTVLRGVESKPEKVLRLAVDLLGKLRPQVGTDSRGKPTLSLEIGHSPRSVLAVQEEILALPEELAQKRKRRLVLVFDEFQEIQRFPGAGLEKAMRSHFQTHRHVSYLFAGSRESALRDMASRERSPFYKFGRMVTLGPISPQEFVPFLQVRFKRGGLRLTAEMGDAVLAAADDVPYNVQRLCHQLWALRAGKVDRITEQDIGDAIAGIVEQDAPHFSAGWDRLSLHQRQVLQAIARSGGRNVFAGEFLTAHRLGSHSSVQTSLRQLLKEQVLAKANGEYRFADPFFREWVALRLP
ncbi:MAG: putative prokaryotic ATPase [candidate division NC10 bacterium]|nr:putative prokaryotic ATPase [candidate division NC10 bacterium]